MPNFLNQDLQISRLFRWESIRLLFLLEDIGVSENRNFIFLDGVLFDKGVTHVISCEHLKVGEYFILNKVAVVCASAFNGCKGLA